MHVQDGMPLLVAVGGELKVDISGGSEGLDELVVEEDEAGQGHNEEEEAGEAGVVQVVVHIRVPATQVKLDVGDKSGVAVSVECYQVVVDEAREVKEEVHHR